MRQFSFFLVLPPFGYLLSIIMMTNLYLTCCYTQSNGATKFPWTCLTSKKFFNLTCSCDQRMTDFCIEDMIKNSDDEVDFICSPRMISRYNPDKESISDDEKVCLPAFGSVKKDAVSSSFAGNREAKSLVQLNENIGCPSSHVIPARANRSCGRGKAKPKFSFRFQAQKEDLPLGICSENVLDIRPKGGKTEQPADMAVGNDCVKHSMAELLDCFREKSGSIQGTPNMYGRTTGKRIHSIMKKSISSLGYRNMDDADVPEALDSGSSSEDEGMPQNLKLVVPENKQKTMADHFHEAFSVASVNDEASFYALTGQSGRGLFGKLQQVMRNEKEGEVNFLKRLQTAANPNDEKGCLYVRILSRCLEAKLTVCHCSFSLDEESSQWTNYPQTREEDVGRTTTILFSSRICSDVELDVGNLICIHPPWKEVHIAGTDKTIILSTYFSQIST